MVIIDCVTALMLFIHLFIAFGAFSWAVSQGIDLAWFYAGTLEFVQAMPLSVYLWIVVVCCILIFLTVILEQLKAYEMMFVLSRTVFEISLLGVSLLSFGSIVFCWRYLKNIWFDLIPVVFIPYLGVFVAMIMFRLFDFNYPYKKRVVVHVSLSWIAIALVVMHLL